MWSAERGSRSGLREARLWILSGWPRIHTLVGKAASMSALMEPAGEIENLHDAGQVSGRDGSGLVPQRRHRIEITSSRGR